jgi:hypothetical protein
MKVAYPILIVVALGFVVWDILTLNIDIYTGVASAALFALTVGLGALEKREQQL